MGTWSWPRPYAYRGVDSLYRDSLRTYYAERGIDLDRYFDLNDPYRDSVSRAVFDSLLEAFRFLCTAPEAVCAETIWVEERKLRIDADSMHYRSYQDSARSRNKSIVDSADFAYSILGGRLVRRYPPGYADTLEYRIANDDTLILGPDTLIRTR